MKISKDKLALLLGALAVLTGLAALTSAWLLFVLPAFVCGQIVEIEW